MKSGPYSIALICLLYNYLAGNDPCKIFQPQSVSESIVNWRFTVASSGQQDFLVYSDEYPVSEPIVKESAFLQATGEAIYTQDVGRLTRHLNGVYILNMGKNALPYADFTINIPPSFTAEEFGALCDHKTDYQGLYQRNDMGSGQAEYPGDTIFAQGVVGLV